MDNKPSPKDKFEAQDKTLPFKGPEAIDGSCLECFEYAYADTAVGQSLDVETTTEEFTSVCPFSGLPDFARVTISYMPDRHCLELRSLKYYLMSYRDVGIWYEHLANRMLEDLAAAVQPRHMQVVIECAARGGLTSTITAEYDGEARA